LTGVNLTWIIYSDLCGFTVQRVLQQIAVNGVKSSLIMCYLQGEERWHEERRGV